MVSITGESRLCALFCRADADPNLADDRLFRPIHWACVQGHKTVVRILINHAADLRLVNEVTRSSHSSFTISSIATWRINQSWRKILLRE